LIKREEDESLVASLTAELGEMELPHQEEKQRLVGEGFPHW
jgi:hypothetical protein